MLLALTLKNFTIVEDLTVNLCPGLNIITGETGAGKSVIIDAVNIILGDKASSDNIKSGMEEAYIEALFDISLNTTIQEKLIDSGFDVSTSELLIKRVINRSSRSRVYINGSLSTLSILAVITQGLVDIFSQHEHQSLMKAENHLKIIDDFGQTNDQKTELNALYQEFSSTQNQLKNLIESEKNKFEKEDYLKYQLQEIDNSELKEDEDKTLEEQRLKLVNQERLRSTTSDAYELLYDKDDSILAILKNLSNEFGAISKLDPALSEIASNIDKGLIQLQETTFTIRDYLSDLKSEGDTLEKTEDRIHLINGLKRKYGNTISEIIDKRDQIESELDKIENHEERVKELNSQCKSLMERLEKLAFHLSEKRKTASKELTRLLEKELKEVGIKGGRFHIDFDKKEVSSNGMDSISFLFSANPDEDPKPLTKVASGGELSRIMLVLKEVLARVDGGSVIIFDEADTGVGGAVAEAVGLKIRKLSEIYQVICITHLPQVAKFADSHLSVVKTHEDNKTQVNIKNLNEDERVIELARMIGGFNVTQKTLDAAQEMLKH